MHQILNKKEDCELLIIHVISENVCSLHVCVVLFFNSLVKNIIVVLFYVYFTSERNEVKLYKKYV